MFAQLEIGRDGKIHFWDFVGLGMIEGHGVKLDGFLFGVKGFFKIFHPYLMPKLPFLLFLIIQNRNFASNPMQTSLFSS